MTRSLRLAGALLPALLFAMPALAQVEPAPITVPAGGSELSSIMTPAGRLRIGVPVVINLEKDFVGKPINIPVEAYYGVNDNLSIGISHDSGVVQGVTPYAIQRGLCFGDEGCPKTYNNLSLDALLRLVPGTVQLAAHGGLDFLSFSDPSLTALRLGFLAKAPLGENIALVTDPRLFIGINNRDLGNKERLSIPLALQIGTASGVRLAAMTGISGPIEDFKDSFWGFLGAYLAIPVGPAIDLFGTFSFENLYGHDGGTDLRALVVGMNFTL